MARTVFKFMAYMGSQYQTVYVKARSLASAQSCMRARMPALVSAAFIEAGDGFAADFETDD